MPADRLDAEPISYEPAGVLGSDRESAIRMMREIEELTKTLPALDCGSCGAPTCRAFASDVVRGLSSPSECIVAMRERLSKLLDSE